MWLEVSRKKNITRLRATRAPWRAGDIVGNLGQDFDNEELMREKFSFGNFKRSLGDFRKIAEIQANYFAKFALRPSKNYKFKISKYKMYFMNKNGLRSLD